MHIFNRSTAPQLRVKKQKASMESRIAALESKVTVLEKKTSTLDESGTLANNEFEVDENNDIMPTKD